MAPLYGPLKLDWLSIVQAVVGLREMILGHCSFHFTGGGN